MISRPPPHCCCVRRCRSKKCWRKRATRLTRHHGATVGRLLCLRRTDDVGRRGRRHDHGARQRGRRYRDRRARRCRRARAGARYRGALAAAAVHQFRGRRLRGGKPRPSARREQAFAADGRIQAGALRTRRSSPATPRASLPARRCRRAPRPSSCRKTSQSMHDGKVVLPAGLKPGANVRPAGEDIPAGHVALRAGQRLRPQHVALAAAFGLTQLDVRQAHPRRGVFDRRRTGVAGRAARAGATVRFQPLHADGDAAAARLRGLRSRHFARRSRLARARLEAGRRRPRPDPHHRRRLHRRGRSRQGGGRERRLAGAVADGDQARPARGDGHHRRHAVDRPARQSGRELCHLCPCGAADGAGAGRRCQQPLLPMPVRAAFTYKKKIGRREYVRVICGAARTARWRRSSFRAKARACCRRWSRPTAWSNSARTSRGSSRARRVVSCPMQPDLPEFARGSRAIDDRPTASPCCAHGHDQTRSHRAEMSRCRP